MQRDSTKSFLWIGFSAILGLMFLVATVSLSMLYISSTRIKSLVNANNTKSALIHQMRLSARERTVSLQNMLLLEDPFKQDEQWMHINAEGGIFAEARLELLNQDLTPAERALLDEQAKLTSSVAALHLRIANLIMDGDKRHAYDLLENQAMPGQQRTFELLSRLLDIQTQAAARAVRSAERDYRNTLYSTLALMIGITALGTLIARFVTRRTTETEQRLYTATEQAQITLQSIGDGVITTNIDGLIEQLNPEAERLTGWLIKDATRHPLSQVLMVFHESRPDNLINPVELCLKEHQVITSETDSMLRSRNGRTFAIEYTVAPIFNQKHDQVTGAILVLRDVTQMRSVANELAYQAKHDMLTGLMNRREFERHLETALGRIPLQTDEPHWLCYLDLDQFKLINDTCGHLAGDELLKQISATLRLHIRDSDLLARMGGDEFAILLSRCSAESAMHIIERIRHSVIGTAFLWNGKSFSISSSFGLIPITPENGTLYQLLSAADMACYVAKDAGRNRIHTYQSGDSADTRRSSEMQWVHRINQALEDDRFVLYHQPIIPLQGRVYRVHSEILMRMLDEDGTLIPPMDFLPAAERYNLMSRVDRWVIRKTLGTLQTTVLCAAPGSCTIAINLSGQSLCDDEFLPFVMHEFDLHHVDPHHICFEITETCAIGNLSRAIHFIATLRARGCRFALDDFGSGLSSFGYLKNLQVEYIKIDGAFVRDIKQDPMNLALVDSINQIGHAAGIQTIAEYVENKEIQHQLQKLGVDYAQGFGLAKPEPLNILTLATVAQPAASRF